MPGFIKASTLRQFRKEFLVRSISDFKLCSWEQLLLVGDIRTGNFIIAFAESPEGGKHTFTIKDIPVEESGFTVLFPLE